MALVRSLEYRDMDPVVAHTEVECTYSTVQLDGVTYLQIDTYGSQERLHQGKQSQTIRFSPEAIGQLRAILEGLARQ